MPASIRPLTCADRDAWSSLWRDYQIFYAVDIAPDVSALAFERLLDPCEPMGCALALDDAGAPAGLVHWIFHRSTWSRGRYCYLQDLFVAHAARGRGHGRRLIEHVYALAAAEECARVHWLTHETNAAAMELYDRIAQRSGFLQYRRLLA